MINKSLSGWWCKKRLNLLEYLASFSKTMINEAAYTLMTKSCDRLVDGRRNSLNEKFYGNGKFWIYFYVVCLRNPILNQSAEVHSTERIHRTINCWCLKTIAWLLHFMTEIKEFLRNSQQLTGEKYFCKTLWWRPSTHRTLFFQTDYVALPVSIPIAKIRLKWKVPLCRFDW